VLVCCWEPLTGGGVDLWGEDVLQEAVDWGQVKGHVTRGPLTWGADERWAFDRGQVTGGGGMTHLKA